MWTLVVVLVLVGAATAVVVVVRRPRTDDLHSVRSYHSALGTLEHLSGRVGPPAPPTTVGRPRPSEGAEAVEGWHVPPVPVRGATGFPQPGEPLVFDDARSGGDPGGTPGPWSSRDQRQALASMNHRRRRGTGLVLVVLAAVVLGGLVLLGGHTSPTTSARSSTTTAPRSAGVPSTGHRHRAHRSVPTTTTLPTRLVATTTASDGTSATYPVSSAAYPIVLRSTGPCWVQVDSSTGSTLWAGTLQAGTDQTVRGSGTTTVQFGTPTLSMSVEGVPVVLPTGLHTPFVATFTPTAGTTPSTTSTTTTTVPPTTTTAAG